MRSSKPTAGVCPNAREVARSAPSTPVQVAAVTASIHTARPSCRKAGEPRISTPVGDSSGESRLKSLRRHRIFLIKSFRVIRGDSLLQIVVRGDERVTLGGALDHRVLVGLTEERDRIARPEIFVG